MKRRKKLSISEVLNIVKQQDDFTETGLDLLAALVRAIRPKRKSDIEYSETRLRTLLLIIKNDSRLLSQLQKLFQTTFNQSEIAEVITDSGIIEESGFFLELNKRISHKVLPPIKPKGSFLSIIDTLFDKSDDYVWIQEVDNRLWSELFQYIGFEVDIKNVKNLWQICRALSVVSYHIASIGLRRIIREYLKSTYSENSFVEQSQTVQSLIQKLENGQPFDEEKTQLSKHLYKCEEIVSAFRKHSIINGASVRQTHLLLQLSQYIGRIYLILSLLKDDNKIDYQRIVSQFKLIVENENTKNSIRQYLLETVQFLAYRIAEHERDTGEHYITSTPGEYKHMLKSAMKGGLIISFIVLIKTALHHIKLAPFWQAFAYSTNYALGFITIQFTGSTLATKQPAMTASAIAASIEKKDRHVNMPKLAILISKVFRSQTASFVGNLVIVFPLTLLIAFIFDKLLGVNLAQSEFAHEMVDAQNPLKSLCLLYACFTGVFLFISGIISGYFDNLVLYGKIPQRIYEHPFLKRSISEKKRNKIAKFTEKKLGSFMGNLTLGFFLGMASFIGDIFGIPFDIRHITISTGYYAIGLYELNFNIPFSDIFFSGLGVILIGFLNFLVSFSLAFSVALTSRKIEFKKYRSLGKYLYWLFKKYPKDFFFPPKTPRMAQDFMRNFKDEEIKDTKPTTNIS